MLVREVLMLAAENMGREDLSEELAARAASEEAASGETDASSGSDSAAELSEDARSLLRCYRIVENEVALDYFPLEKTEKFSSLGGKVQYAVFSSSPVNIVDVKDADGNRIGFTAYAAYLDVSGVTGSVSVTYAYAPPQAELGDEVAFPARISGRILAAGICSEFLLTCGRYAESEVWEGKFRDALRATGVFRRKLCSMRSRRWV